MVHGSLPGGMRRNGRGWALAVVALAMVAAACDKAQLVAPTKATLSISAASVSIPSSGSTQVQAYVVEQAGTPVHNGTTVRFSTNLGRVQPAEAQTVNGIATTTFFADGVSGVAQIRATSGGASAAEGASNTVDITVGSSVVGEGGITLRANPSTIPVTGGTVDIIAAVVGANNAAAPGVVVSFSTNRGTLSATQATTDARGEARVQLTTNREAIVTATVGSRQATVNVAFLTPATVTLSASSSPVVGQPMTLTVTPASGTAPRVVISWGDGSQTDLGVVASERKVTHVYEESGSYGIQATATDNGESYSNALGVTVAPRPSPGVSASPSTGTTSTTFVFTITPATGGAGLKNVTIDFGDGSSLELGAITASTQVNHQFSSAGTYTVRVTQTDGAGKDTFSLAVVTVS